MQSLKMSLFRYDGRFRIFWDIFMLFAVFLSSLLVPFRMMSGTYEFDLIYWLITVAFCLDILVVFNSTIRVHSAVVSSRPAIARIYVGSWLLPDLLAALPFAAIADVLSHGGLAGTTVFEVLMSLRLLRLLKLAKVSSAFRGLQDTLSISPSVMRLAIFGFWLALAVHFIALGWLWIGAGEQAGAFLVRYVRALYWTTTTVATIGYGDITPDHDSIRQMGYTIFVQLLGVGMFGYVIGNIASLLANIDVAKTRYLRKMEEVREYMRIRRIPADLQERIKNHYAYLWETRRNIDSTHVLEGIPHTLETEVALFLNRAILEKVSLFKDLDEIFVREVVSLLAPVVFMPDDYIIRQGEYGDCMYFVNSGDVEVLVNGKPVARLGAGSFFGEAALIQGEKRTASIHTLSHCDVYRLSKKSFDDLRTKYPEFDRKIGEIMAERLRATRAQTGSAPERPEHTDRQDA